MRPMLLACCAAACLLAGCVSRTDATPYAAQYRAALQVLPGTPQDPAAVARRFVAVFADLGAPDLQQRIEALYADRLYFNDTLTTLRDRDALLRYLRQAGQRVQVMEVEMLGAFADGNDVYLRWSMHLEFKAGWREANSDTVGITHLRLDDSGRIVLHQDFWDSAEGIYRQVPVLRRFVGTAGG